MSAPVPVTLRARSVATRADRPTPVAPPEPGRLVDLARRVDRTRRLAAFGVRLAVKEHVAPGLRVSPLVAELFLTENCNLRCVSCNCWRETTRHELTTDEWLSVIDDLAEAGIIKANFTGGEPLLRRDAATLIAHARHRGIHDIHLNTNGILLDDERRAEVLTAGVRSFNVSVDGATAERHDHIRGQEGAFDTTVRHLRALVAERDRYGLRVNMNYTVMNGNVDQLAAAAELAAELKAHLRLNLAVDTTFLFRADEVAGLTRVDEAELRRSLAEIEAVARRHPRWVPGYPELAYVLRHFTEGMQAHPPCAESQLKLMVHSRGEIGGCWGEDPTTDLRRTTMRSVLASAEHHERAAKLFRKECVGCGSNYALNLRFRPRTHWDRLRWRVGLASLADR